jgi:hypothetical protein
LSSGTSASHRMEGEQKRFLWESRVLHLLKM